MHSQKSYDVFLSYDSADHEVVEVVARKLRDEGLEPFLDRWYLAPGARWRSKLEDTLTSSKAVTIFVGPGEMGSWQQREVDVALDLQSRNPYLPVIPVLLPGCGPPLGFLRQLTWVDLRSQRLDLGIAILAKAARGESPGPELQTQMDSVRASICPYRGLLYFREEDAPFFFGREVPIERLMDEVQRQPFVAVVGASGSGKSSVVRAGLVPKLRRDRDTAWETVILVPTDEPLKALSRAFLPLLEPSMGEVDRLAEANKLAEHFRSGTISFCDIVGRILEKQSGTDRVLIVVDQFEELYTLTSDEEARRRFVDELLAASSLVGSKLNITLTLRGDFVGKALAYRPLSDRLQDAQINLGPMTRKELECAIRKPAEKIQLEFEPGLVGRILNDVGDEPGNLPLLEFVLKELWDKRRGRILLNETYDAIGGLQGAVATKADDLFKGLSSAEQKILQRIFLRIVRPSAESGLDTRRRAAFTELPPEGQELVVKLANERLLVTSKSASGAEQTVEVAHEALISNWGTLRSWVNEDREFLLWRERLSGFLAEWERVEKSEDALLRGPLLTEAQKWFDQRSQDLSDQERGFIATSRALREHLARDERERQERELESAHKLAETERQRAELESKGRRRQRYLNIALLGLLLVAGVAVVSAIRDAISARKAKEHVIILNNVEPGQDRLRSGKYLQAAVYFAAGYKHLKVTSPLWEVMEHGLIECSKAALAKQIIVLKGHSSWVSSGAFSDDGKMLATGGWDRTIRLWDMNTGKSKIIIRQPVGKVSSVNFSPAGTSIVAGCSNGYAYVWDLNGQLLATLDGHRGRVNYAAFSPDAKHIVTASDDCTARIWSADGTPLLILKGHTDSVKSAVYSADGKKILTAAFDGTARIWDSSSGQSLLTVNTANAHQTELNFAAFNPNGDRFATVGLTPEVFLWDVNGRMVGTFKFNHGRVNFVQFGPSGDLLAAASDEDNVKVWQISTAQLYMSLENYGNGLNARRALCAVFSPDGTRLLITGDDGSARVWDTRLRKQNIAELVATIEKESPWKIVEGQLELVKREYPSD